MENKGLKILLSVLLVLCIIMAGALIGKEYIGDNIKEASNRNGVDVVRDTSDAGKAEDNAFINGTGADEPTGILHHTDGAKTALTVETLTYDDVISLYFSVDKEYRKNGIWLMNDKTALALRKLKDNDGNYLWNQANDTILGKQVIISEYMPDIETGTKPIAFGDFSYYWIVGRKPVTVRTLLEKFVLYDQIGYLAFEFLDGKLVRNEAIKVIQMADAGK